MMTLEYYEDVKLHQKYRSRHYPLSQEEIIAFAKQWVPQPFHIDAEFARGTRIGSLFASASHLFAICTKLWVERNPRPATIAGMGLDEFRFLTPARPGDVLWLEREAISKRRSKSDSQAGIVRWAYRLVNQRDEVVLSFKGANLTQRRPQQ